MIEIRAVFARVRSFSSNFSCTQPLQFLSVALDDEGEDIFVAIEISWSLMESLLGDDVVTGGVEAGGVVSGSSRLFIVRTVVASVMIGGGRCCAAVSSWPGLRTLVGIFGGDCCVSFSLSALNRKALLACPVGVGVLRFCTRSPGTACAVAALSGWIDLGDGGDIVGVSSAGVGDGAGVSVLRVNAGT
eukprot:741371-Ditylum_brightwellii.AAC.1